METSKKVFVNTLPTNQTSGGILTFLLELLYALADNNNARLSYCLICSEINEYLFTPFRKFPNFSIRVVKVDNNNPVKRIFYEQFILPKFLNVQENAVVLNICNVAMLRCKLPQITIIQAQLSIAELRRSLPKEVVSITIFHKIYYDMLLERSIRKSAKTIAVSNYMVQFLKKYEDKLVVIHEGVNFDFFANPEKNLKQNVRPYILSLSTLFPHKNMNKVIEAFSIFIKKSNPDFDLLIVGKDPDGRQMSKLKKLAEDLGVADRVIFKGWVATEDIPAIYSNATLFLYLSGMEFFGLPVLEAMASAVPVIAANKMSIPEVVNNAGILVEPDDVENVSTHIERIVKDEQYKNSLVAAGKENIKNFDWHFTAKKFETLFLNAH